jgi:hypothetical protein
VVAFSIVLLTAGTSPSNGNVNYYWLSVRANGNLEENGEWLY